MLIRRDLFTTKMRSFKISMMLSYTMKFKLILWLTSITIDVIFSEFWCGDDLKELQEWWEYLIHLFLLVMFPVFAMSQILYARQHMIQVLYPLQLPPEFFARLHANDIRVAAECEWAQLDKTWLRHRLENLLLLLCGLVILVPILNYFYKWLLKFAETKVDDDLIVDNDRWYFWIFGDKMNVL